MGRRVALESSGIESPRQALQVYRSRIVAEQPSIFVSYAHDDGALAHALAAAMEAEGARIWLDQGELLIGDSLLERISEAVAEVDFVAALVSPASLESNWCRKEIALAMSKQLCRGGRRVAVLPLRVGDVTMPASLADVKWLQLDSAEVGHCAAQVVRDAARHLAAAAAPAASTGLGSHHRRNWASPPTAVSDADRVSIIGVDTDGVGRPRGDGTRGSGLYRVPLLLNRVPHPAWSENFADAWNSPPTWTSMHRPGIASVQGDRIVLDGTTIEQLERYHLKTLKLVVRQLNERVEQHLKTQRERIESEERATAEHERAVRETTERLHFDDESA